MPVVLRHNESLELNLAEYRGVITLAELQALTDYLAANCGFLKYDALNVVSPGAAFRGVPFDELDRIFGRYKSLYAPINFQIIRRSAWLCFSPAAQAHVDHWSGKRDAREAMSTTLRQFASTKKPAIGSCSARPKHWRFKPEPASKFSHALKTHRAWLAQMRARERPRAHRPPPQRRIGTEPR